MRAAIVVQQLCKSCRTCFMFYCMFYFTCDRSLNGTEVTQTTQMSKILLNSSLICLMLPLRQGIRFDPDLPQTLRLEFAKTNTKVVKPKQQLAQLAVAAAAAAAAGHTQYIQPITGRKH